MADGSSDSESDSDGFFGKRIKDYEADSDVEETEEVKRKDFELGDFTLAAEVLEAYVAGNSQMVFLNQNYSVRALPEPEQMVKGRLRVAFSKAFKKKQKMFRSARSEKRKELRDEQKRPDYELLSSTGIRAERRNRAYEAKAIREKAGMQSIEDKYTPLSILPPTELEVISNKKEFLDEVLRHPAACYICKRKYDKVHHFYDNLCPNCAPFHFQKRLQTCDLRGHNAILTGGRIKIGFEIGLKLLRAGANLLVTTRFPKDCIARYAKQADFEEWRDRLKVYGLDLRFVEMTMKFIEFVKQNFRKLDILVNNACQTVRRPPEFYAHLRAIENQPADVETKSNLAAFTPSAKLRALKLSTEVEDEIAMFNENFMSASAASTALAICEEDFNKKDFPEQYNEHNQRIDLRSTTSWTKTIGAVQPVELFEVTVVNSLTPFILVDQLKPLFDTSKPCFIVNVSAMEGKFSWKSKKPDHPHTNMAKASLNMMTRTCGEDLAKTNIFMTSVDTGWITDELPASRECHRDRFDKIFHPPLDEIDGAARCVDPIFAAVNGAAPYFGVFLKDYKPTDW